MNVAWGWMAVGCGESVGVGRAGMDIGGMGVGGWRWGWSGGGGME